MYFDYTFIRETLGLLKNNDYICSVKTTHYGTDCI